MPPSRKGGFAVCLEVVVVLVTHIGCPDVEGTNEGRGEAAPPLRSSATVSISSHPADDTLRSDLGEGSRLVVVPVVGSDRLLYGLGVIG